MSLMFFTCKNITERKRIIASVKLTCCLNQIAGCDYCQKIGNLKTQAAALVRIPIKVKQTLELVGSELAGQRP